MTSADDGRRPDRISSPSVWPSTNSVMMNRSPSISSSAYTVQMPGWVSPAAARASRFRRSRCAGSRTRCGASALSATVRPRRASDARYTQRPPPGVLPPADRARDPRWDRKETRPRANDARRATALRRGRSDRPPPRAQPSSRPPPDRDRARLRRDRAPAAAGRRSWARLAQLAKEPGARQGPAPLQGGGRQAERIGRVLDAEPREVAKLHDARLL